MIEITVVAGYGKSLALQDREGLKERIDMPVFYGTLIVSRRGWSDDDPMEEDHLRQGFAWYDTGVAYYLPDATDGPVRIEIVRTSDPGPVSPRALRAIEVPYRGMGSEQVYTYTIDEIPFSLEAGSYRLRYELLPCFVEDGEAFCYRVILTFVPDEEPGFAILKTGHANMTASSVLRTDVSSS